MPEPTSPKEAALYYARHGFAVFPCVPDEKKPMHMGGFHIASTDDFQIDDWWDAEPNANVAIYPGGCTPPYLVVDIDKSDSEDGSKTWDALMRKHRVDWGGTLIAATPGGGFHAWYKLPAGTAIQSSVRRIGPGLDVRSHGGYVLVPPSIVGGKPYTWHHPVKLSKIKPAWAWLIEAAGKAEDRHPDADLWLVTPDQPRNLDRAAAFLRETAPAIAGEGGNAWTLATACIMRDFGVGIDRAHDLMYAVYNPRCIPPWEEHDLSQIITNAYRYAKRPAGTECTSDETIRSMLRGAPPLSPDSRLTAGETKVTKGPWMGWDELQRMPAPIWLIHETMQEHAVVLLYAPWSSYKTFIVLDMLLSLATNTPWGGYDTKKPLKVAYMTSEARYGIAQRVAAWAAAKNEGKEVVNFLFSREGMVSFRDPVAVVKMALSLKEEGVGALVLDTVSHAMAGMDENSTKDVSEFMDLIYKVRDAANCAIIMVHHTGKDAARGARGSEEFSQKADVVLRVSLPTEHTVILDMTKQKDAERWRAALGFRIHKEHGSVWLEHDDEVLKTASKTERILWVATAQTILRATPIASLPVSSFHLAKQIAEHLREDSTPVPATETKIIAEFLGRTAGKAGGVLDEWVATHTARDWASSFRPPPEDTNGGD